MNYILERLSEPSTWRGLALIAAAAGLKINPELENSIIAVGMASSGLIGALAKDK
jgi:hypothetical protein